mgnify:CR=1 FL=1
MQCCATEFLTRFRNVRPRLRDRGGASAQSFFRRECSDPLPRHNVSLRVKRLSAATCRGSSPGHGPGKAFLGVQDVSGLMVLALSAASSAAGCGGMFLMESWHMSCESLVSLLCSVTSLMRRIPHEILASVAHCCCTYHDVGSNNVSEKMSHWYVIEVACCDSNSQPGGV